MNNWPTITGIDTARVTETLGGDVDFFQLLLTSFVGSAASGLTTIRQQIEANDRASAAAAVHRLRGEAGNLGAMQAFSAATALETSLRNTDADVWALMAAFESALVTMLDASRDWLAQKAATPVESGALRSLSDAELTEWQAQLQELAALLAAGSARARRQSQAMASQLQGSTTAAAFAPILKAVDEFDFPGALTALNQLRA